MHLDSIYDCYVCSAVLDVQVPEGTLPTHLNNSETSNM